MSQAMTTSLIYARSRNYCIGRNGDLPWHLPDEYQFFDDITMGHAVIMGRRTYEDHDAELKGRLNIVVSQSRQAFAEGVLVAPSLEHAIGLASAQLDNRDRQAFVIGGAGLLTAALPLATTVFETVVDTTINGDVFIDAYDFSDWETERLVRHPADNDHAFAFETMRHRRPG